MIISLETINQYQRISDYIVSNPENWAKDKFKTDGKS